MYRMIKKMLGSCLKEVIRKKVLPIKCVQIYNYVMPVLSFSKLKDFCCFYNKSFLSSFKFYIAYFAIYGERSYRILNANVCYTKYSIIYIDYDDLSSL